MKPKLVIEGGRPELAIDLLGGEADPVPEDAIDAAVRVMRSTQLFRYSSERAEDSEAALLERDLAALLGAPGAVAVNSCTSAIFLALVVLGVGPGDEVLMPAITFTAVPSAIVLAGARPVLCECKDDMTVDERDLAARLSSRTRAVVLSHMRGRLADVEAVAADCAAAGVPLVEDCAHSFGGSWRGRPTGSFGDAACLSFQSRKIVNAGEGGVLLLRDPDALARATILAGAYERLWQRHFLGGATALPHQDQLPTFNLRMSNVTAAIARPQLPLVPVKVATYRRNHAALLSELHGTPVHPLPEDPRAERGPDTVQFRLPRLDQARLRRFCEVARLEGVPATVFGLDPHNARCFWNWRFLGDPPRLPRAERVLRTTCEVRMPLSLTSADAAALGRTLVRVEKYVARVHAPRQLPAAAPGRAPAPASTPSPRRAAGSVVAAGRSPGPEGEWTSG